MGIEAKSGSDGRAMAMAYFCMTVIGIGYLFPISAIWAAFDYWKVLFPEENIEFAVTGVYQAGGRHERPVGLRRWPETLRHQATSYIARVVEPSCRRQPQPPERSGRYHSRSRTDRSWRLPP